MVVNGELIFSIGGLKVWIHLDIQEIEGYLRRKRFIWHQMLLIYLSVLQVVTLPGRWKKVRRNQINVTLLRSKDSFDTVVLNVVDLLFLFVINDSLDMEKFPFFITKSKTCLIFNFSHGDETSWVFNWTRKVYVNLLLWAGIFFFFLGEMDYVNIIIYWNNCDISNKGYLWI